MTATVDLLTLETLTAPMTLCPFKDPKVRQWWAEGYTYAHRFPRNLLPTLATSPKVYGDAYAAGFFLARAKQGER